jgi:hypothetical protein
MKLGRLASAQDEELADSRSCASRLIIRLRQPFGAFLLVQQGGGEYKRIASDMIPLHAIN